MLRVSSLLPSSGVFASSYVRPCLTAINPNFFRAPREFLLLASPLPTSSNSAPIKQSTPWCQVPGLGQDPQQVQPQHGQVQAAQRMHTAWCQCQKALSPLSHLCPFPHIQPDPNHLLHSHINTASVYLEVPHDAISATITFTKQHPHTRGYTELCERLHLKKGSGDAQISSSSI